MFSRLFFLVAFTTNILIIDQANGLIWKWTTHLHVEKDLSLKEG